MKPLRIGIIGCGHWGKNYIRVFHELPQAKVVLCCDSLPKNIEMMKERFPFSGVTTNADEVLTHPDIDAIIIATPASSHLELASQALAQGKHLIVEKPLALTSADCQTMIDLAQANDRLLMVGHTFLYNDSIRKVAEMVQAGSAGDLYYMNARRTHLGMIREDVASFWDLAPHDVSIFSYLLNDLPHSVSAVGGEYLKEGRIDFANITLFYKKGIMGNIQVSWVDANKVRDLVVIGSKQRIVFDDLNSNESVKVYEKGISFDNDVSSFGEFQYLQRDGDILSPKINHREPLKVLCQHFIECVMNNTKPLTDGQNGMDVVKVLEAATISMEQKGTLIEIR